MSQRKEKYARGMEREIAGLKQIVNDLKITVDADRRICANDEYRKQLEEEGERERRRRLHRRLRKIERSMDRLRASLLIAIAVGILALSIVFVIAFKMGQAGATQVQKARTTSAGYMDVVPTSAEYRKCETDAWAGK